MLRQSTQELLTGGSGPRSRKLAPAELPHRMTPSAPRAAGTATDAVKSWPRAPPVLLLVFSQGNDPTARGHIQIYGITAGRRPVVFRTSSARSIAIRTFTAARSAGVPSVSLPENCGDHR